MRKKQPIPTTLAELRFRAAALRMRGYRWERISQTYIKTIRVGEHRARYSINSDEVKRNYYDREDFLDFIDYMDRRGAWDLSNQIARRAIIENSKWKID